MLSLSTSHIKVDDVHLQVGLQKQFNLFELQEALCSKQVDRAMIIAHYFAKHNKKHPLPPIVAFLYTFFSRLLMLYSQRETSSKVLSSKLKIPLYSLSLLLKAKKYYTLQQVKHAIYTLHKIDKDAKAINTPPVAGGLLLSMLISQILDK